MPLMGHRTYGRAYVFVSLLSRCAVPSINGEPYKHSGYSLSQFWRKKSTVMSTIKMDFLFDITKNVSVTDDKVRTEKCKRCWSIDMN